MLTPRQTPNPEGCRRHNLSSSSGRLNLLQVDTEALR